MLGLPCTNSVKEVSTVALDTLVTKHAGILTISVVEYDVPFHLAQ
jgi:hypothetical protein